MSQVKRMLNRAMTVEDLIAHLEDCPPTARVIFACDYGDMVHTKQALPVESIHELAERHDMLCESGYSLSGVALCDENDEDFEDIDADVVVIG